MTEIAPTQSETAAILDKNGPEPSNTRDQQSYRQILKSSTLVGGSSAANILIGVVRTKAVAAILGPTGVGLTGLYGSVVDIAVTVAGLGVNSSGVRQIAAAAASGDESTLATTVTVLRRLCIVTGLLGSVCVAVWSGPLSKLTFGDGGHAKAIALLSLAILFRLVSAGQSSLIQGMRRISDIAAIAVWSSAIGAAMTLPLLYVFRYQGIVASMVAAAGASLVISWRYSRRIRFRAASWKAQIVWKDASALLRLGIAFMATSLLTMGAAYLIRVMILREIGVEATGLYQSAWAIGGLYVGFILQAMQADFYPRLTAAAEDNSACNRLVNEQSHLGLMLAGPGVIGTLTCAPVILSILYTGKFDGAVQLLRWLSLGTLLQVVSWPMGFIILAKGRAALFLISDLAWSIVFLGLAFLFVKWFGLSGAGIAFFASYVFHVLFSYAIVRRISGYAWTAENREAVLVMLPAIGMVFLSLLVLPSWLATLIGLSVGIATSIYSARRILASVSSGQLTVRIQSAARRIFSGARRAEAS